MFLLLLLFILLLMFGSQQVITAFIIDIMTIYVVNDAAPFLSCSFMSFFNRMTANNLDMDCR